MSSDDRENGRACATAFIARFREFQKESMPIVVDDWRKRRIKRRKFKVTNPVRCAFAIAISPYLYEGMECPLVLEDYAILAGVRRDKFEKFASKNPSFAREKLGPEWNRRVRRPPLKDRFSGQVIFDRNEPVEKAKEDYKRGPPATRISIAFKDLEFRNDLKTNEDFARGFLEALFEEFLCELLNPTLPQDSMYDGMRRIADPMMRLRAKDLEAIFDKWKELTKRTISGIKSLKDKRAVYGQIFLSNCDRTIERLSSLSETIEDDIGTLEKNKGSLGSFLLRSLEPIASDASLEEGRLREYLDQHGKELFRAMLILEEIGVMLYYTSPMAAMEFARYTDFVSQIKKENAQ